MPATPITFDVLIAPDGFGLWANGGEEWAREGFDGYNYRVLGKRPEAVTVTGRKFFGSASDAVLFITDVRNAIFSEVSLSDGLNGFSNIDCLLKRAALREGRPIRVVLSGAGLTGDYMVEFSMEVRKTN